MDGDTLLGDFDCNKHTYKTANTTDYDASIFKAIGYCINYNNGGIEIENR